MKEIKEFSKQLKTAWFIMLGFYLLWGFIGDSFGLGERIDDTIFFITAVAFGLGIAGYLLDWKLRKH